MKFNLKDVLGKLCPPLVTFFIGFIITVCFLFGTGIAHAQEVDLTPWRNLRTLELDMGVSFVIQQGQFNCAPGEHRAFGITNSGMVMPACVSAGKEDVLVVRWETGTTTNIHVRRPGHTDGPGKEQEWSPQNQHPEKNAQGLF